MKKMLIPALLFAAAIVTVSADERTAHAQSAGDTCTSEMFERANVSRDEIDVYEIKVDDGKPSFVVSGKVKTSQLPQSARVNTCGGYTQVSGNGKTYFIKRSAYQLGCTCDSGQRQQAGVPGAGESKQCKAIQCPAQ